MATRSLTKRLLPPQYEATLDNMTDAAWRVKHDYNLPDGWEMTFSPGWTTARAPWRTATIKAATPKRTICGTPSTPWDMRGLKIDPT